MPLQIFVEDELSEAYEVLAWRGLGRAPTRNRRELKSSRVQIGELISFDGLLDLTSRSVKSGYDCVIFVLDQEVTSTSPDRPVHLANFKNAFVELCNHLSQLSASEPLSRAKVTRIVSQRCLEGWLLSDPQAIVDAMRGGRGVQHTPGGANTEDLAPTQACEQIAHHIRQVGIQLSRRDLQQTRANNVKRLGRQIADKVVPQRARRFNRSLAYFFDMVQCQTGGCDKPCPE